MAERFPTASEEEYQRALDQAMSHIHAGLLALLQNGSSATAHQRRFTYTRSRRIVSPSPETSNNPAKQQSQTPDLVDAAVMMFQPIKEQFPVLTDCDLYALVTRVVTEVTSGLDVPIRSSGGQEDVSMNIEPSRSSESAGNDPSMETAESSSRERKKKLTGALSLVALLTLIMDIGTTLYKPARGVVFGRNREAYYLTLAAIFASGVAEVLTAVWLSRCGEEDDGRSCRFSFGRAVLCASLVPFVAIVAISAFA